MFELTESTQVVCAHDHHGLSTNNTGSLIADPDPPVPSSPASDHNIDESMHAFDAYDLNLFDPAAITAKLYANIKETKNSENNDSASRSKRIFRPSYRNRLHLFQKRFPSISPSEKLIDEFNCALHRGILLQGKLYVSMNHISFYSNIFGFEKNLVIEYQKIKSVKKASTIKLFRNAIEIKTYNDEKYFITSFLSRDSAFKLIQQLWQNARKTDGRLSWLEICAMIRQNYVTNSLEVSLSDLDGEDELINLSKKVNLFF